MTSERCIEGDFFHRSLYKCQRCETKYEIIKGYEFTENCGWSDEQQQIESPYRPCRDGTFNDGSQVICQNCRSCPPPQFTACKCKNTSDTICCKQGEQFFNGKCIPQPSQTTRITTASTTVHSSVASSSPSPSPQNFPDPSPSTQNFPGPSPRPHNSIPSPHSFMPNPSPSSYEGSHSHFIGIYVCFGILSTLALACLFLFIRRRTKPFNEAPEVHDAPLKTVLDNLDVLEELVLVLDPYISGAKNTRHLAAQCSFSFAWINYAYSMKDHKSPLVAVLEGVVTKNPDWTVGHLAELLTAIGRNDAVEILAKLPAGV
uniref:IGF-like family receptor 1 n=1 Tax=Sinocyclocheilus anshuiensis TaxID=1608454 RepID=A0A671SPK8_9TELE